MAFIPPGVINAVQVVALDGHEVAFPAVVMVPADLDLIGAAEVGDAEPMHLQLVGEHTFVYIAGRVDEPAEPLRLPLPAVAVANERKLAPFGIRTELIIRDDVPI